MSHDDEPYNCSQSPFGNKSYYPFFFGLKTVTCIVCTCIVLCVVQQQGHRRPSNLQCFDILHASPDQNKLTHQALMSAWLLALMFVRILNRRNTQTYISQLCVKCHIHSDMFAQWLRITNSPDLRRQTCTCWPLHCFLLVLTETEGVHNYC